MQYIVGIVGCPVNDIAIQQQFGSERSVRTHHLPILKVKDEWRENK